MRGQLQITQLSLNVLLVTKKDPQVFLRPKETVYIPMKYVSFEANHTCTPESPGGEGVNSAMRSSNASGLNKTLSTRIHKVHFHSVGECELLSSLL